MEQHQKNANALAKFLESSPYVEKVLHPGSPSHPQHEVSILILRTLWCVVPDYAHGQNKIIMGT